MLLKTKIFIMLSIVLIGFSLLFSQIISYASNRLLEDSIATRANSIETAFSSLIEKEKEQLSISVRDYAFWEDMGEFGVKKRDIEWLKENLSPWVKEHFGYDLVVLIKDDGEIIINDSSIETKLNEIIPDDRSGKTEFYLSNEGLVLYSSSGVFDSEGEEFYSAFLIFGKVIDEDVLKNWKDILQVDIILSTQFKKYSTESSLGEISFEDKKTFKYHNGYVIVNIPVVEDNKLLGNFYMYKLDDTPNRMHRTFLTHTISFIIAGLIISILMSRFFISRIFKPLDIFRTDVEEISSGRYDIYLDISGNDEIASLARSFYKMVSRIKERETALDSARKTAQKISYTDDLTSIPNRRYMEEYVEYLINSGIKFSLVFIDLDKFKSVNDFLGHKKGDEVLHNIAKWFRDKLRRGDIVARYGGDEFCLILVDVDKEEAKHIVQRLYNSFHEEDFYMEEIPVSFSYGIACYPDDADDADELINLADKEMYGMKENKNEGLIF